MILKHDRVLITGAAGYIGSHVVKNLYERGFRNLIGIDFNFGSSPNAEAVKPMLKEWYEDDIAEGDWNRYDLVYTEEQIDVIIHLAAFISVEESVKNPGKYWLNNMASTGNIIRIANQHHALLYFASTGTAFDPASPYAETKLEGEKLIKEFEVPGANFRFYNVSGCDPMFKPTGEATHLIRRAASAAKNGTPMTVFGIDWGTRDGTAVRDYVDVRDLADAIATAVESGYRCDGQFICLGSGMGFTVNEVLDTMDSVTGKTLTRMSLPRRDGDVGLMICPADKIYHGLMRRYTLSDMCRSALEVAI